MSDAVRYSAAAKWRTPHATGTIAAMAGNGSDHAVLLVAPDWAEACMAETLLGEAGIPCMRRGSNGALVGCGDEANSFLYKQDLMVPARLLAEARAVLAEAWPDRE